MKRRAFAVALFLALVLPRAGTAQLPLVHVHGSDHGTGLAFRRAGGDCVVLTPRHVVTRDPNDIIGTTSVSVTVATQQTYESTFSRLASEKLMIISLPAPPEDGISCSRWPEAPVIDPGARGFVRYTLPDGTGRSVKVTVDDPASANLVVCGSDLTEGANLIPGVSGGILFLDDRPSVPAAMVNELERPGCLSGFSIEYLGRLLSDVITSFPPPPQAALVGSVVVPGLGQWYTARKGWGAATALVTLAAMGTTAFVITGEETRTRTVNDFFGTPRTYPYQVKNYPLRRATLGVWLLSGAISAVEATRHAHRRAIDTRPKEEQRHPTIRPSSSPGERPGELAIEISF